MTELREITSGPEANELHQKMEAKAAQVLLSDSALEEWQKIVMSVVRKSKGLSADDEVTLPTGERGRYLRYAMDSKGRLSLGKPHGRRQVRLKPHQAAQNRLANQLFGAYLASEFTKAQAIAKETGAEIKPIDADMVRKAQAWAARKAEQLSSEPARQASRAERRRQKASHRINSGLIAGNSDRSSHASA